MRSTALHILAGAMLGGIGLAAQAAHPLITEDAAAQGHGHFQLELTSEHARTRRDGFEQYTALTYGVAETGNVVLRPA